jgi:dsDNA-binding SOS-regulon protein
MKIKRVASYETTDGQIFTDKKDAQAHQKTLDRIDQLEELVAVGLPSLHVGTSAAQVARFVLVNADAIRAILPQRAAKTTDEPTQPAPVEVAGEPTIENDMSWVGAGLAGSLNALGA